jgi:DNA-binding transcriptional ArsR family regulator
VTDEQSRTVLLTDPRAMRALAHPLRLRLLGELRLRGPQSVGMLSQVVDEAPASVSYHLGTLASYGFVEEAPELARDRRERWWKAAHARTSWAPVDALDDPDKRAASDAFRRAILHRYLDSLERYLESEVTLDREWVTGTSSADSHFHLTAAELLELRADLEQLTERWAQRSDAGRPDARPVSLIYHAFRRPE